MFQAVKFFIDIVKHNSLIEVAMVNNLIVEDLRIELNKLEHSLGLKLLNVENSLSFTITEVGMKFYQLFHNSEIA